MIATTNHITEWEEAQKWELNWHLNQQFNSFNEELKQYTYASLMGLNSFQTNYYGIRGWDMKDKSILDIGGGEVSILLKTKAKKRTVIDPLNYPEWVRMRYKEAGIFFLNIMAEEMNFEEIFDDCWIYNCLQHTESPEIIIEKAKKYSKIIRIFEWIETGISEGHIHNLTENKLNEWLGGRGKITNLNQQSLVGTCYSGIFKGDNYEI